MSGDYKRGFYCSIMGFSLELEKAFGVTNTEKKKDDLRTVFKDSLNIKVCTYVYLLISDIGT